MTSRKKPLIVYDPETGQQIIVYENPASQVNYPVQPITNHPIAHPPAYPPAAPRRRKRRRQRPSRKEYRRREEKARFAGGWFFLFACSWIPTAIGFPGFTILAWGGLAAWTLYKALR